MVCTICSAVKSFRRWVAGAKARGETVPWSHRLISTSPPVIPFSSLPMIHKGVSESASSILITIHVQEDESNGKIDRHPGNRKD